MTEFRLDYLTLPRWVLKFTAARLTRECVLPFRAKTSADAISLANDWISRACLRYPVQFGLARFWKLRDIEMTQWGGV